LTLPLRVCWKGKEERKDKIRKEERREAGEEGEREGRIPYLFAYKSSDFCKILNSVFGIFFRKGGFGL